jgi:hypothetical protein
MRRVEGRDDAPALRRSWKKETISCVVTLNFPYGFHIFQRRPIFLYDSRECWGKLNVCKLSLVFAVPKVLGKIDTVKCVVIRDGQLLQSGPTHGADGRAQRR